MEFRSGTTKVSAVETSGTMILGLDNQEYIYFASKGSNSFKPFFTGYVSAQRQQVFGDFTTIGAEIHKGKLYSASLNNLNGSVRIDQYNKSNGVPIKKVGVFAENSNKYNLWESRFKMAFSESTPAFWSENEFFNNLWGFQNKAWQGGGNAVPAFMQWGTPSAGIVNQNSRQNTIAIIDTGVRYTHEDLRDNMWVNRGESVNPNGIDDDGNGFIDDRQGIDFHSNGKYWGDPEDIDGHGTHVAGTAAAASNTIGVIGTNPSAKIMPINVFTYMPDSGDVGAWHSDTINGIYYAGLMGAKVINMSLGGPSESQAYKKMMADVAKQYDVLYVVAAGNDGQNNDFNPSYPAAYNLPSIISVAASNDQGQSAWFTNYGKQTVDLYAPGEGILSTYFQSDSSYDVLSGTSMAAPFVAGAVSSYWARNPGLSAAQVKNQLLSTTTKSAAYQDTLTGGIINMDRLNSDPLREMTFFDEPEVANSILSENLIFKDTVSTLTDDEITSTVIATLSQEDSLLARADKERILRRSTMDKGKFKHIVDVEIFEGLDTQLLTFSFDGTSSLGRSEILSRLFKTNLFESFELDQVIHTVDPIEFA